MFQACSILVRRENVGPVRSSLGLRAAIPLIMPKYGSIWSGLLTGSVVAVVVLLVCLTSGLLAAEPESLQRQVIGYTVLQTDLPGGRHANIRTARAVISRVDGTERRLLGEQLADLPDAWTQFAGWSPDGKWALVHRGWQDPANARWEEEHRTFRFQPGQRLLDSYLIDVNPGAATNVTGVDRVSDYNSASFLPDGKRLLMTSLIQGTSKPFLMDLDGRNKRDISGDGNGFSYGLNASPDGQFVAYHENYQISISQADGRNKQHVNTGNRFNFVPSWSPDGQWLLFVSGVHGNSHPYLVRRDGTGLRKLVDLNGYQGWILHLDVPDFHEGSSDVPVWSADGKLVFFTAKVGENVELFQVTLDGAMEQLTTTPAGSLHYHPTPSPDGQHLLYGSKRMGVRQLYVMSLANRREQQITQLQAGHAAMWAHWQPGTF